MTELWGLGDLALAMPFLQTAARHTQVTLLAKAYAAPLLKRFAPEVELIEFDAPWTVFKGKYRLNRWPWQEMRQILLQLKDRRFSAAVSARPDPREHLFLRLTRADQVIGFPRAGSGLLLSHALPPPLNLHRTAYWGKHAHRFGWEVKPLPLRPPSGRHIVIHIGAAQPTRRWPTERFATIANQLTAAGWQVTQIDETQGSLDALIEKLATADHFIGNDSGPGHIAALLGVPTFTIGPQLPEVFATQHPKGTWINGAPCKYKPCRDYCRYSTPHCLMEINTDAVWKRLTTWLDN